MLDGRLLLDRITLRLFKLPFNCIPLGLGHDELAGPARGIGANPAAVLPPRFDSLSGAPALTVTRVRVRLVARRQRGGPRPLLGAHG